MKKYKIFAGLGGGFGGASYHYTDEFKTEGDAIETAYHLAVEEYESYAGLHGLCDYEAIYEDCEESGFFDTTSENEKDDIAYNAYIEYMEGWLDYYVKEVEEPTTDIE